MITDLGTPEAVLATVRRIAGEVAAAHADDVDTAARFPSVAMGELGE
jgi:hypothetical protein